MGLRFKQWRLREGYLQFCLVLVRLRRRLSRCSKICSKVSWASLLLELRRLKGRGGGEKEQHYHKISSVFRNVAEVPRSKPSI